MSEATVADAPEPVGELPPSCRLVWLYLEVVGEATQQQIVEGTQSAPRTTRYALDRLETADVVERRPSTKDPRQSIYRTTRP